MITSLKFIMLGQTQVIIWFLYVISYMKTNEFGGLLGDLFLQVL